MQTGAGVTDAPGVSQPVAPKSVAPPPVVSPPTVSQPTDGRPRRGAARPAATPDGRRSRWTEHRRARRGELVAAAVEAVRAAGPDFAVDDVARSAGVSKTVIYRYFSDKDELVDAVLESIANEVLLPRLLGELAADRSDVGRLRAVIAEFVAVIEEEPALYRFAYAHAGRSGRADLVAATEREVAEALGRMIAERLAAAGRDPAPAMTWSYGVVGMVQLATHWWAAARGSTAAELVDQLTALAAGGLMGLLPADPDRR